MVPIVWVLAAVTIRMQEPAAASSLARAQRELPALEAQLQLAELGSLSSLAALATLGHLADAPAAWPQDPGDSLYRAARQLLNRGRYAEAATAFTDLIRRHPRSAYTPDAHYWQAFALYKTDDAGNYRLARTVLEYQRQHYPQARTLGEAETLYARIQGELARQGDPRAAEWVRRNADATTVPPTPPTPPTPAMPAMPAGPPTPPTPPTPSQPSMPRERGAIPTGCANDDDDPRIAALNALLQMDADAAVPILKKVLERRDPCSVVLRRKAVFIVSQLRTSETEDILLAAARTDPDGEVREQAVFWLSQVGSERAVGALDSILRTAQDPEIQKKALFALSQIESPRATQILRTFAERADAPVESREQAIFWIGQQQRDDNGTFLRALYARLTDEGLKEKVIFSLSQTGSAENGRWLIDLALNEREPIELRKKALFWAGQMGAPLAEFAALYDRTTSEEIKEQLIFAFSQRDDPAAVERLIDIAKHEANVELRKKAVFWLGQSRDPRARQALLDIINQ